MGRLRIPFDNVGVSAILSEVDPFLGGFVQEVRQPDEFTIVLRIYRKIESQKGLEGSLLMSSHPQFARIHFVTRRTAIGASPPVFCSTLRARIGGAELVSAVQIARDRIVRLTFVSAEGTYEIIAELMGKHSNLILIDSNGRILSAAKWVPRSKSSRPILPNTEFLWPPVIRSEFLESSALTQPSDWFRFRDEHPKAVSTFFRDLPFSEAKIWSPHLVLDSGAYPLSVVELIPTALPRSSLSLALEQFFAQEIQVSKLEELRAALLGQLHRLVRSRDQAISEIQTTLEEGKAAETWQVKGELVLAYGHTIPAGSNSLEVTDYVGNPLQIDLDPNLTSTENALILFERAKKAKARVASLQDSVVRLHTEKLEVSTLLQSIQAATRMDQIQDLQQIARDRRWLTVQVVAKRKEDRPFEGHKVRELIGPGGYRILYGENAESNDYLTLRVAKPNDYWLHVRGSNSAHVVIQTANHPEKVGKEQLTFAAKVAVQNSPSKHAGYVPVDYTLKKYVRKPRGSAVGAATYTNEKTIHIES